MRANWDWKHAVLVFGILLIIGLGGCAEFRDGVGRTDFWADRERSKY